MNMRKPAAEGSAAHGARRTAVWLAAFDLNNTLAAGDLLLSRRVLAALRRLKQLGHRVVVASGNSREYLRRVLESELAPVGAMPDALVCENGALVEYLGAGPGRRIRYEGTRTLLRSRKLRAERDAIARWLLRVAPGVHLQGNETTVCADGGPPPPGLQTALESRWTGWFMTVHGDVWDIFPRQIGKQTGVRSLARRWGIPRARSFAIGDGENDLGLLGWVARPAAPANAAPAVIELVRRRGGYVAAAAHGDAVVEALRAQPFWTCGPTGGPGPDRGMAIPSAEKSRR